MEIPRIWFEVKILFTFLCCNGASSGADHDYQIVLLKRVFSNMEKVSPDQNKNEKNYWWIFLGRVMGERRDLNLTVAIGP